MGVRQQGPRHNSVLLCFALFALSIPLHMHGVAAQTAAANTTATPATRSTTTPSTSPTPRASPLPTPTARTSPPATTAATTKSPSPTPTATTAATRNPPATSTATKPTTTPTATPTPPATAATRTATASTQAAIVPTAATTTDAATNVLPTTTAARAPSGLTNALGPTTSARTAAVVVTRGTPPPPVVVSFPPPGVPNAASTLPPPAPLSPPPSPPAPPGYTAVQALMRIAGPDVLPFSTAKQSVLIYALASVMTTVTQNQMGIILVQTAASRRRLLMQVAQEEVAGTLRKLLQVSPDILATTSITSTESQADQRGAGTVDVTLEFNTTGTTAVGAVTRELQSITSSTTGTLQAGLQAQGERNWGITLLSAESAEPRGRLPAPKVCRQSWAGLCLDGSGLSSAGVKGIIAAGVIVIVGVLTLLCVCWDVRRRSGRDGQLQYQPDSPWHQTPMARYLGSLTGGRLGTPRKPHTPKGGPGGVQMSAHAGEPDTPGSSAATVSPHAHQHQYPTHQNPAF